MSKKDQAQLNELIQVNEELRQLFEQERRAMNDEIQRLEDALVQVDRQFERKMSVFKSKLVLAAGAYSVDRGIVRQFGALSPDSTIDEIIQRLQDYAHFKVDATVQYETHKIDDRKKPDEIKRVDE